MVGAVVVLLVDAFATLSVVVAVVVCGIVDSGRYRWYQLSLVSLFVEWKSILGQHSLLH